MVEPEELFLLKHAGEKKVDPLVSRRFALPAGRDDNAISCTPRRILLSRINRASSKVGNAFSPPTAPSHVAWQRINTGPSQAPLFLSRLGVDLNSGTHPVNSTKTLQYVFLPSYQVDLNMRAIAVLPVLILTAVAAHTDAFPSPEAFRPLSTQMLDSVISRRQGIVSSGAPTSTLEAGILSHALRSWVDLYSWCPEGKNFSSYLDAVLDATLPSFKSANASTKLPMDRLTLGYALLNLHRPLSANESAVLSILNGSLALQPRTPEGGFWYYIYANWSYLDGTVSFLPFMAKTGWSDTEMLLQLHLLETHCAHQSGLLVHGYDASKTAVWANNSTGGSPFVWGRSMGWFLMGLVEAYPCVPQTVQTFIRNTLKTIIPVLIDLADNSTGVWWQLPTFPGREGNFLESSSTALYIFSILKASRLQIVEPSWDHISKALKAYSYVAKNFVVHYGNGTLGYNGTVAVNSLNSTATYQYYTTRPIVPNSLLGESAFVLASLEVERMAFDWWNNKQTK
ncbi:glycoside hydrolase family 105 protein [Gonapodya prolifera JEL478]|uniref:Glycoside hydrolase family 105 protein n=1 Tax=Gonapodya prolifera (strain JEL478) TaxID=1344416 RepID=A0A139AAW0_GONPJ|nr:glycoside hydrolase family 105 protein [Gonapodya prolifera JEL478]|eukprot:KXS13962.1 glycoside hydrolase family 105 protein [Gonapodya prolifera JEL478]